MDPPGIGHNFWTAFKNQRLTLLVLRSWHPEYRICVRPGSAPVRAASAAEQHQNERQAAQRGVHAPAGNPVAYANPDQQQQKRSGESAAQF
jgi:hypothetical protein